MNTPLARLVVLISGNGSNLQVILDACARGELPARVAGVISDQAGAYGLERARQADVAAEVIVRKKDEKRVEYDARLAAAVVRYQPDWVVLAGWMRLLSSPILSQFMGRVVNLHPALPGFFPGTHAIERAFEAFQRGEVSSTGVMVHLVPDEKVDAGPVLAVQMVDIQPEDTLERLAGRIHQVEHVLLVDTLRRLIADPNLIQRME